MEDQNSVNVSIVIPVYNSAKYLSDCIESVLLQDYRNFELLLVGGRSDDGSETICRNYAGIDNRVKALFFDENLCVGKNRNIGIDHARGEYIAFIDSDDMVEKNYIRAMMDLTGDLGGQKKEDCIITGFYHKFPPDRISSACLLPDGELNPESKDAAKDFFARYSEIEKEWGYSAVIAKLFKTRILKENHIRFRENFSILEDMIFVSEYLQKCETVRCSSYQGYYYCHHENPSLTKVYDVSSAEAFNAKLESDRWILRRISPEDKTFYYEKLNRLLFTCIRRIYTNNIKNRKEELQKLLKSAAYTEICRELPNSKVSAKQRLFRTLVLLHRFDFINLLFIRKYRK